MSNEMNSFDDFLDKYPPAANKPAEEKGNLDLLDEVKKVAELYTGVKSTFVNLGWSNEFAEKLTVEFIVQANSTTRFEQEKELIKLRGGASLI